MLIDLNVSITTQEAQAEPGLYSPGQWFFGVYKDEEFSSSISTYTEDENFKFLTIDIQPGGSYYFVGNRLDTNEEILGPQVAIIFTIPADASEMHVAKIISETASCVAEESNVWNKNFQKIKCLE